jgi:indole-3-glycerol phosphate synthase
VTLPTILERITTRTREDLALRQRVTPMRDLRRAASDAPPCRDFTGALRAPGLSLIAEVKRASPSQGTIRNDLDPGALARTYAAHGAAALSVLTDGPFFHGSLDDLRAARAAVSLPVLRKDFILDPYQIYEARAAGADAVLLITAVLDGLTLTDLHTLAGMLGMAALVEVHNAEELERALAVEPAVVGINNRDLHTFEVQLETTERLRPHLPENVVVVAESGVQRAADAQRLDRAGVDAVLVGTALVSAPDPGRKVEALLR